MDDIRDNPVFSPVTFPHSGRCVHNRLVKAAMYEHLAPLWGGPPDECHLNLYSVWGREHWGIVITGNVQVSSTHLGLGRDISIPKTMTDSDIRPFKRLAEAIQGPESRNLAIMQISHCGRQSSILGGRILSPPLAPSAIKIFSSKNPPLVERLFHSLLFRTPRAMTLADIDNVVAEFVHAAVLAERSGFDGVQLHNAHGYLLSQFVSDNANKRTDDYSMEGDNALRLLHRIVIGIREATSSKFTLGVKFNSGDFVSSSASGAGPRQDTSGWKALMHVRTIANWRMLDFIEVSGGDYQSPTFTKAYQPSRRQAFFAEFSSTVMEVIAEDFASDPSLRPLIILTGGLRTPSQLRDALNAGECDLLGLARPAILAPHLPSIVEALSSSTAKGWDTLFAPEPDLSATNLPRLPLVGASFRVGWYTILLRYMSVQEAARSQRQKNPDTNNPSNTRFVPDYSLPVARAQLLMWLWLNPTDSLRLRKLALILIIIIIIPWLSVQYQSKLLARIWHTRLRSLPQAIFRRK